MNTMHSQIVTIILIRESSKRLYMYSIYLNEYYKISTFIIFVNK